MDGWIDLGAYSTKYGVSQSTLRRRIRAKAIPFRMERGKYLLQDSADTLEVAPLFSRNISKTESEADDFDLEDAPAPATSVAASAPVQSKSVPTVTIAPKAPAAKMAEVVRDPVEDFLNSDTVMPIFLREDYERLLVENRKLKSQIAELETLVKALEAEVGL